MLNICHVFTRPFHQHRIFVDDVNFLILHFLPVYIRLEVWLNFVSCKKIEM